MTCKLHCLLLVPVWVEGLGNNTCLDPIGCKSSFYIPARTLLSKFLAALSANIHTARQTDCLPSTSTSTYGSLKPLKSLGRTPLAEYITKRM